MKGGVGRGGEGRYRDKEVGGVDCGGLGRHFDVSNIS